MTLIDTVALESKLSDPNLRILDATAFLESHPDKKSGYVPRSGRIEWEQEHIPGAQNVDVVSEVSAKHPTLPFMMPTPEKFCSLMGDNGCADKSEVVIYSAGSVMWATRLWWMFRSVGFERCAVLDGGFAKWKAESRLTSSDVTSYPKGKLTPRSSSLGWATKSEVVELVDKGGSTCLIDALSPRDYSGESSKYGGKGHIPGSHNVFYHSLLAEDGTFLAVEKLREIFAASKALESERVICYCGGGVASTMAALALTLCGHRNVAVYDGSMLEWAGDKALPLNQGLLP